LQDYLLSSVHCLLSAASRLWITACIYLEHWYHQTISVIRRCLTNLAKGHLHMKKLQNNKSGFTIIEVLIVLAIAGLIMLIVFLAVPALQRNSRNTQYRNDAASLLAAATEWSNNNNGSVPATGNSSAVQANAKTQSITTLNIAAGSTSVTPTFSAATIVTGVKCGTGSGSSYSLTGSSTRAMAVVYAIENSSGAVVAQCTES
jgi:prepilin-type N-terminal cleavage/methylation domain-containing protein